MADEAQPDPEFVKRSLHVMAEGQLTKLFVTFQTQMGMVYTLRAFEQLGVDAACEKYAAAAKVNVTNMLALPGVFASPENLKKFVDDGWRAKIIEEMNARFPKHIGICVEGATLTFTHGVLDWVVNEALAIANFVRREFFKERVAAKKVALADIAAKGYDTAEYEVVQSHLRDLQNESLMKRMDVLHQIVPPKDLKDRKYKYNADSLSKADTARHELVHGLKWPATKDEVAVHVEYLMNTGFYVIFLLAEKLGLRMHEQLLQVYLKNATGDSGQPATPRSDLQP